MLSPQQYYMLWFAGVVTVCFFIAFIAQRIPMNRPNKLQKDPLPNPLGLLLPAVIFCVFSGLRKTIGDTEQYIDIYQRIDPETAEPVRFSFSANNMFHYLEYRLRLVTDDPMPLLMICAVLALVPAIYILYQYASPFEMGIGLFVLTGYYSLSMNGMRQYLAAGFVLMGTKYLFSEKKADFFKFLIFVLIAWTFHSSALIMIPIYFIVRRPAWRPMMFLLVGATIVGTLLFDRFLPTFLSAIEDSDYGVYAHNGWFTAGVEGGSNFIRIVVLLVPLVLAYLWRERMSAVMGREWDILVNLSVFDLMFYILSLYNWLFARLAIYTSLYVVVMLTHLISKGTSREDSRYMNAGVLALYAIYFYNMKDSIIGYRSNYF